MCCVVFLFFVFLFPPQRNSKVLLEQTLLSHCMADVNNRRASCSFSNTYPNHRPLRGQKTSSWEGGVRVTAFLWGGKNVLPNNLRGTQSDAFIHIADWYGTLSKLVGVDPEDDVHGVPRVDSIDAWQVLMLPNASAADSARVELPLAFCPNTIQSRGQDNCAPTAEGGGWKPNGTKTAPHEWRNGALIVKSARKDGAVSFHKMIWGLQFGYGVRYSQHSPNASGTSHISNDPGCPNGCLYDVIADPGEYNDLSASEPALFRELLSRQAEIGLEVYQTNYSDVDDDASCLSIPNMTQKYSGFLGPRCGVSL